VPGPQGGAGTGAAVTGAEVTGADVTGAEVTGEPVGVPGSTGLVVGAGVADASVVGVFVGAGVSIASSNTAATLLHMSALYSAATSSCCGVRLWRSFSSSLSPTKEISAPSPEQHPSPMPRSVHRHARDLWATLKSHGSAR